MTYEYVDVGPIMQDKGDSGKADQHDCEVAWQTSTLVLINTSIHILVLRLWWILCVCGLGCGLLDNLLRNFGLILESQGQNTFELSVGMRQHDICFEVTGDLCWHYDCQVVIIAINILSRHFLLNVNVFDILSVLNSHVEVTRAENMNRFLSVPASQGNTIHKSLLNLDWA